LAVATLSNGRWLKLPKAKLRVLRHYEALTSWRREFCESCGDCHEWCGAEKTSLSRP